MYIQVVNHRGVWTPSPGYFRDPNLAVGERKSSLVAHKILFREEGGFEEIHSAPFQKPSDSREESNVVRDKSRESQHEVLSARPSKDWKRRACV